MDFQHDDNVCHAHESTSPAFIPKESAFHLMIRERLLLGFVMVIVRGVLKIRWRRRARGVGVRSHPTDPLGAPMPRTFKLDLEINGAFLPRRWEEPDNWMRLTKECGFPVHS